jgi:hypothetical protein
MENAATLTGTGIVAAAPAQGVRVPRRRRLRRVAAVAAGLVATFIITTAVDMVLHATGVFPPFPQRMADGLFVLALAYRIPFNIGGAYLAARLAPDRPMGHALALGAAGVVLSVVGAVVFWEMGPPWYSLANVAIAMPCAWLGGKLRVRARSV